jgi:hypothetical protein
MTKSSLGLKPLLKYFTGADEVIGKSRFYVLKIQKFRYKKWKPVVFSIISTTVRKKNKEKKILYIAQKSIG